MRRYKRLALWLVFGPKRGRRIGYPCNTIRFIESGGY